MDQAIGITILVLFVIGVAAAFLLDHETPSPFEEPACNGCGEVLNMSDETCPMCGAVRPPAK